MSGDSYLIDTNVLIDYLGDSLPSENKDIDDIFRDSFVISVISEIEFLGWSGYLDDPKELRIAEDFLAQARIVPLVESVVERVIDLRQQLGVPLADGVIAATAIDLDATLATRNVADFESIQELALYNPHTV